MAQQYTVQRGDTLYGISLKFKVTLEAIQRANSLKTNALNIGQTLIIPTTVVPVTPVRPPVTNAPPAPKQPAAPPVIVHTPPVTPPKPVVPPVTNTPPKPPVVPPPVAPPAPEPTLLERINAARAQYQVTAMAKTDYNQYTFVAPNPMGGTITASFRDNVKSVYTVYRNGIGYAGNSRPQLPLSVYESVGLNEAQARALRFVSLHEGCFDAINSYDKAIFSFGFIQFTASQATGSSLSMVLAHYKHNCPDLFRKYFIAAGLDVGYILENGAVRTPITVVTLDGKTGERLVNDAAFAYIKDNIQLFGPFIQSGYEPTMVREQLRIASYMYVQKALTLTTTVTVLGQKFTIPLISQIIQSEGMSTILIDLAVNRGVGGMSKVVNTALTYIATQNNFATLSDFFGMDELHLAKTIVAQNTDERITRRTQNIIDSGLSFNKNTAVG
jgi:LysM domain